jgi:hypothetical protein
MLRDGIVRRSNGRFGRRRESRHICPYHFAFTNALVATIINTLFFPESSSVFCPDIESFHSAYVGSIHRRDTDPYRKSDFSQILQLLFD